MTNTVSNCPTGAELNTGFSDQEVVDIGVVGIFVISPVFVTETTLYVTAGVV